MPIAGEHGARSPTEVASIAQAQGLEAEAATGLADAFARISQRAWETPPRILVAGSLYLAGEVLAANGIVLT